MDKAGGSTLRALGSLGVWKVKWSEKSPSRIRLFATPWTVAHQAPPSMEFSRQEYWSGLPFSSLGEGSSRPRDGTRVSRIVGRHFTIWATRAPWASVQLSRSLMSNSLWPHESQHARPPCLSPTPGDYSHSCPLVGDAIQPSHPLSSPSPPAPNPSQHQGLFRWVNSSHEVARVLEFHLQHQSFQWTPRTDLL